jgi:hypothetical protein
VRSLKDLATPRTELCGVAEEEPWLETECELQICPLHIGDCLVSNGKENRQKNHAIAIDTYTIT